MGFGTAGRPERVVSYLPGSYLLLFTDGLVERRDETIDTGFSWLGAAFAAVTALDPASLCEVLTRQALQRTGREDDTAVLCAFLT